MLEDNELNKKKHKDAKERERLEDLKAQAEYAQMLEK